LLVSPPGGVRTKSGAKDKPAPTAVAPFTDADVKRIAALPAAEQVEEVRKELKKRNPEFDGTLAPRVEDGAVLGLAFLTDQVTNIAPVRALTRLQKLDIHGSSSGQGVLADLSPLKGMPLKWLNVGENKVSDLTPLTGMPLEWLAMWQWRGADLTPLKNMPLKWLNCGGGGQKFDLTPLAGMPLEYLCLNHTQVSDLTPLKDAPLTDLECANTLVSDVSPLKGKRLTRLLCHNTQLSDLSPLQATQLKEIRLTPNNITQGLDILRDMKSLKTIGIDNNQAWPAAEFWERYDKGEFKK
jgi:Leucine-rich repeat (LRR) protein